jgi:hypothetical protein
MFQPVMGRRELLVGLVAVSMKTNVRVNILEDMLSKAN